MVPKEKEMREKDTEDYLRLRVKEAGGRAFKFVSPGNAGVPDRIVLLPDKRIAFVELKATGGKSTPLQTKQMNYIAGLGFSIWLIDSKEKVGALMQYLKGSDAE